MSEKPNRAARRQAARVTQGQARDNLRHAVQCVAGIGAFGKAVGVEEGTETDFLLATAAMIIATIANVEGKRPSVVLEEFDAYVRRLDPTDPSVVDH